MFWLFQQVLIYWLAVTSIMQLHHVKCGSGWLTTNVSTWYYLEWYWTELQVNRCIKCLVKLISRCYFAELVDLSQRWLTEDWICLPAWVEQLVLLSDCDSLFESLCEIWWELRHVVLKTCTHTICAAVVIYLVSIQWHFYRYNMTL